MSAKLVCTLARYQILGSESPSTPISRGSGSTTPNSSMMVRFGAWVRLARKDATTGRPSPTPTISPSFSSRAPAAAINSNEVYSRSSVIACLTALITQNRICAQSAEIFHPADPLQIFPVIFHAEHIVFQVFLKAFHRFRCLGVYFDVCFVKIIDAVYRGGVRGKGLVHHMRYLEAGDQRALRITADRLRGDQLLGDDDGALAGLDLFFVIPTRAEDPGIPLFVRHLHLHHGHIRHQWLEHQPVLARKGILQAADDRRVGFLQALEDVGSVKGTDGD